MRDFSLSMYTILLKEFLSNNYEIISFKDYFTQKDENKSTLILRHDVDKKPQNSLNKAIIENSLNITSTYYFRIKSQCFEEIFIKKIAELGHEIGFHYEDLTFAKGNLDIAIKLFEESLTKLRELYPVVTICMHGSPTSRWNNLEIWKHYDYKQYDLIGEPNLDLDFNEFFYLTDTGMAWNQDKYAVRDSTKGQFNLKIKSTQDIFRLLKSKTLPQKVMLNTHPQRWSENHFEFLWEKSTQLIKNQIKRIIKINLDK